MVPRTSQSRPRGDSSFGSSLSSARSSSSSSSSASSCITTTVSTASHGPNRNCLAAPLTSPVRVQSKRNPKSSSSSCSSSSSQLLSAKVAKPSSHVGTTTAVNKTLRQGKLQFVPATHYLPATITTRIASTVTSQTATVTQTQTTNKRLALQDTKSKDNGVGNASSLLSKKKYPVQGNPTRKLQSTPKQPSQTKRIRRASLRNDDDGTNTPATIGILGMCSSSKKPTNSSFSSSLQTKTNDPSFVISSTTDKPPLFERQEASKTAEGAMEVDKNQGGGLLAWIEQRACLGPTLTRMSRRSIMIMPTSSSSPSTTAGLPTTTTPQVTPITDTTRLPAIRLPPWKHVPWVQLQHATMPNGGRGSIGSSSSQGPSIRHLQWDPDGVLLAALTTTMAGQGVVEVYDWDTVVAADRQGRNLQVRHCGFRRRYASSLTNLRNDDPAAAAVDKDGPESNNNNNNNDDDVDIHGTNDKNHKVGSSIKEGHDGDDKKEEGNRNRRTVSSHPCPQPPGTGCFCISPTLSVPLSIPNRTSMPSSLGYLALHWNVHNPDVMALLHLDGIVLVYDLGQVMAWMESQQQQPQSQTWSDGTWQRRSPPQQLIQLDSTMCRCGKSVGQLLFVSGAHLLVGMGDHLACYTLHSTASHRGANSRSKLVWKWRLENQAITSMVSVGADHILLGSQHGLLALIHWKQVQRAAFSVHPMPTVVGQWSTLTLFPHPKSVGAMGIVQLSIVNTNDTITPNNALYPPPVQLHLSWNTPCGWAIQARLDLLRLQLWNDTNQRHVLYSTPPIVSYNEEGVRVTVRADGHEWSLPASGSVTGTGTTQSLLWTKVPAVARFLPPTDQRVLMVGGGMGNNVTQQLYSSRFVNIQTDDEDDGTTLLHCNRITGRLQTISLVAGTDRRTKQRRLLQQRQPASDVAHQQQPEQHWTVSALALHPSEEWLVVAVAGGGRKTMTTTSCNFGLRIYNARNRA